MQSTGQWGGRTPKAGGRLLDGRTWDQMPARLGGVDQASELTVTIMSCGAGASSPSAVMLVSRVLESLR